MIRRTVILGTAAPRHGNIVPSPWAPCTESGRRLATLAGCSPRELPGRFQLENLYSGAAETCDREILRECADSYVLSPPHRYLLAGYEVLRAFGQRCLPADATRAEAPLLCWYRSRCGARVALLPHPSGRNRWYNDPSCRREAERFLRQCSRRDAAWARMS